MGKMGKKIKSTVITNNAIHNGDRVKDKITGFQGIVTGEVTYITGCNQALVTPGVKGEGDLVDSHWFDMDRLEVIEEQAIKVEQVTAPEAKVSRFGADKPAPVK